MQLYHIILLIHIFSVFGGTLVSWRMRSISIESSGVYRVLLFMSLATLFASGLFLYMQRSELLSHSPFFIIKTALAIGLFISIAHNERSSRNVVLWLLITLVSIGERSVLLALPVAITALFAYTTIRKYSPVPLRSSE